MKKILLILIFGMFLLSFTSAQVQTTGPFKQGECAKLTQTCDNCTGVNITSVLRTGDNSTIFNINEEMTKVGTFYNYTFCHINTIADYTYSTIGDLDGIPTVGNVNFVVNPTGSEFADFQMYLLILVLIIIFIILVFSVYGINNSGEAIWQIFYVCLFYVLIFCLSFLFWIVSKNYLYDIPLLENVFWIIWLVLSTMFFPFIIFVSSYILKKEGEALMEAELMGQGYSKEDAREHSKSKR